MSSISRCRGRINSHPVSILSGGQLPHGSLGAGPITASNANLQVVLSAGLALRIDNHFRVVLGSRRTTLSDVLLCRPGRPITGRGAIVGLDSFAPRLHLSALSLRPLAAGFIAPCLPTKTDKLPSGSQWLHEIKHDGFRVIARKKGAQVRLYSRPGNDLTRRFPLIVETLARLRSDLGARRPRYTSDAYFVSTGLLSVRTRFFRCLGDLAILQVPGR